MKPNRNKWAVKLSPIKTLEVVNLGTLVPIRPRFKRFHRINTWTAFLPYVFKSRCRYEMYTAIILSQSQNSFKSLIVLNDILINVIGTRIRVTLYNNIWILLVQAIMPQITHTKKLTYRLFYCFNMLSSSLLATYPWSRHTNLLTTKDLTLKNVTKLNFLMTRTHQD